MKFNIYYGKNDNSSKQELIDSFDTIELAEKFLFAYIKENHPNSGYIRTTFVSDTQRQYDYGHYTMFYTIIKNIEVVAAVIFKDNKILQRKEFTENLKMAGNFLVAKLKKGNQTSKL